MINQHQECTVILTYGDFHDVRKAVSRLDSFICCLHSCEVCYC
ncbi:hypothetical protein [Klebsiella pneumoniae IS33]|uniref:Uncharacterized protein n=1 Tax=Klebsiella pneumoniae IS43 TaxID=1432552 RepID=W1DJW7_KLEPN|nr:hypothetical protein [Klebsiella pneumoniae IS33]CDL09042.1 hypothetical protein [Klebsiella pneumoniae IS43]SJN04544.1 hypothetical protein STCB_2864 [Klebsiella pneumoniae]